MADIHDRDLEQLSAYVDGLLDEGERERFAARLQREPALQAEYEALRRTLGVLQALAAPAPEAGFEERARKRLRRRQDRERRARRVRSTVAWESTLMVLLLLLGLAVVAYLALPIMLETEDVPDPPLPPPPHEEPVPEEPRDDEGAWGPRDGGRADNPWVGSTTSTLPVLAMRRVGWRYEVRTELAHQDLGALLHARFGARRVHDEGDHWRVDVPADQLAEALARVSELGAWSRAMQEEGEGGGLAFRSLVLYPRTP